MSSYPSSSDMVATVPEANEPEPPGHFIRKDWGGLVPPEALMY